MNKAPTLPAAHGALPPEGALAASGRPSGGSEAPTLPAAHGALPPEGALAALGRRGGSAVIVSPRTRIKICGLTREQDVDAAVAAGVDAIGFVLYPPSPRYVAPGRAAELARRLPPMLTPVLLFVNARADDILAASAGVPGATLQFHGDESAAECAAIAAHCGRPFWRAARISPRAAEPFDLVNFSHDYTAAQAILLDAETPGFGGGGKTFNWSRLPPNVPAHLVLSGGLAPANVSDGIAALRGRGYSLAVDVSSGVEAVGPDSKPLKGIKDADKIHRFVAAVRAADASV